VEISCLIATGRKGVGQRARRDLPREPPAILAPAALTFLTAIADDRVIYFSLVPSSCPDILAPWA
jgi:hypothetical protein